MRLRPLLLAAVLGGVSAGASCGGDPAPCAAGSESCKCTAARTCDPGLACQVDTCVVDTRRDAGRGTGGAGGRATVDAGDNGDGAANDALVAVKPPPPPVQLAYLDRAAPPCDDFYQFACGGWQKQNALGANELQRGTYSTHSSEIARLVYAIIDEMVATRTTSTDPEIVTIGNAYQSCMEAATQPAARATLKTVIDLIDPVTTVADLGPVTAELRKRGVHGFFSLYATPDLGAPTKYILTIDQGARQLPTRDYYFDPALQAIRDGYRLHIEKMAQVMGLAIDANAVLRVETALAQAELTPAEKRDPVATYHKMTLGQATALASHFPWKTHFEALGIAMAEGDAYPLSVVSPAAVQGVDKVLTTLPIDDLKHYLRWQVLEEKASLLDQPVLDLEFAFHDQLMNGATAPTPRRATCLFRTRNRFPWQLSRVYVGRYFPDAAQQVARGLVHSVRAAFAKRIQTRPWLDDATRAEAMAKLDAIGEHIGSPDSLPRITQVIPVRPLLDEDLASNVSYYAGIVAALARPVNRTAWLSGSEPIVVNAFYRPTFNDINLPAGILHAPHFDFQRSRVANFAGIGRTIGHELTHGFDDQGRHFDGSGTLREWWSPTVATEFVSRAKCLGDQFGKFEAVPGQFIDPALTMGENLADLGGVRLAYEAFMLDGRSPDFEGFDDRQQFFIGTAQTRCTNTAPDLQSKLLKTDPHSPDKARVNLIVAQMPEFAEAFSCPTNAKQRAMPICEVW
jgi:putative endopeptidase